MSAEDKELYEIKHVTDIETDEHRLEQRQKQIDYGKVEVYVLCMYKDSNSLLFVYDIILYIEYKRI